MVDVESGVDEAPGLDAGLIVAGSRRQRADQPEGQVVAEIDGDQSRQCVLGLIEIRGVLRGEVDISWQATPITTAASPN